MTDKAPLIVVAHDFSPASKAALEHAKELAVRFRARLALVHVVDDSAYYVVPVNIPPVPPLYLRRLEERLRERLERDGELVREGGLDCETMLRRGLVAPQILACLEEQKPLFAVMGTHGLTGWRHALLGSVAERVVQRSRCPVLVVPDPERP